MGGTSTDTILRDTQTSAPSGPLTLPELRPFLSQVGQRATQAVQFPQLDLSRFATDMPLQVPGLAPLQQESLNQLGQRLTGGIPTPPAEQLALNRAQQLPEIAGQQIP